MRKRQRKREKTVRRKIDFPACQESRETGERRGRGRVAPAAFGLRLFLKFWKIFFERKNMKDIKWGIAFHSLQILILCFGLIAVFSFIFTLRWFWIPPALGCFLFGWYLIYRLEIASREVRLEKGWYFE